MPAAVQIGIGALWLREVMASTSSPRAAAITADRADEGPATAIPVQP